MKEATGEGSMTIVTIVIIVALAAGAAIIVGVMMKNAGKEAEITTNQKNEVKNNIESGLTKATK